MIRHGKAGVSRAKTALVIVDLPAGSYEKRPAQARYSAQKIIAETGADGVKLEGGQSMRKQVASLTATAYRHAVSNGTFPAEHNLYGSISHKNSN